MPPAETRIPRSQFLGPGYLGYAVVYGLKQSIYNPIKSLFLDERPKFLDENQHVQTVPWRPDHRDAIPAIAPFLIGPLTNRGLVLGVTEALPSIEAPSLAELANTRFQNQVRAAHAYFEEDLSRVLDYGGSSRLSSGLPVPVSPGQLGAAAGNPTFARVL